MRGRRRQEIISGRVNADGSIATGDGFSNAKTSAGIHVVTLQLGFRLVSVTMSTAGNYAMINADTFTERSFRVTISSTASSFTASDQPFTFIAVGIQQ
jgi:hypothetical protein